MNVYTASDYAGISSKNFSAYYGYEKTDAEGNWLFEATFSGRTIAIPSTELKLRDSFDCVEGLLMGMAVLLDKYRLEAV